MATPQQKVVRRMMPAFFGVISMAFAAALVVYSVASSLYGSDVQAYRRRSGTER